MDSPHDVVESWWPRDAPELALASDERLDERLELVDHILGSNVSLPSDDAPRVVSPEEVVNEMEQDERRQTELLEDALSPVRTLVVGEDSLIDETVYESMRKSKGCDRARGAVAAVRLGQRVFVGCSSAPPRGYLPARSELHLEHSTPPQLYAQESDRRK